MKATRWKITTIVHTEVCEARLLILTWMPVPIGRVSSFLRDATGSKWSDATHELFEHQRARTVKHGTSRCGCPIHATDPVKPEHETMFENNWILEHTERDGDWVIGYWSQIDEAMEKAIKAEIEIRGKDVQSK